MPLHSRTRRGPFCILTFAAWLGCSGGRDEVADSTHARPPGSEARKLSIAIDKERPQLARRSWKSAQGDTSVDLVAFMAGDSLRLIGEHLNLGESASASNRYYFAGGHLRYYESNGTRTSTDPKQPPKKQTVRTSLGFDQLGTIMEISHLVDGQTAPLDTNEIQGVRTRADALKTQAATAPAAVTKPKPK